MRIKRLGQWLSRGKGKTGQVRQVEVERPSPAEPGVAERPASDSMRALLKSAIADAEQIAASIKMRAQAEGEAEAARIVAQAEMEGKQIRGRAEIEAQREAENILSAANKTARITEMEAKQKALQFLVGITGQVEKEVKAEYERAYSRLSAALQNLISEGQSIDSELKSRTARLLEGKELSIEGYEATLLSTSPVPVPKVEAVPPAGVELKPEAAVREEVVEPATVQEELVKEEAGRVEAEVMEARVEEAAAVSEKAREERVEEPVKLESERLPEKVAELLSREEEPKEEGVKEAVQAQAEAAPEEAVVAGPAAERHREEKAVTEEPRPEWSAEAREGMYRGEIELAVSAPVELKLITNLYNYLQTVPELRILYTRGSWDQGTTITVVLEKPMPLISILSQAPGFEVIPEVRGKEGPSPALPSTLQRGPERRVPRMNLALKEARPR